ncbi:hypothetical protein ES319_A04G149500v1 [Gossypium barbadense]|uniref:Uncharacterized protein n=2 Tax=Gossypium TaxID=3633 RepID=A0A5J5W9U7_GOSBA|nr:hypothetical protein ES319_A04G149500v1 [Gossypium barbadense]TYH22885.1 hypothetical protein ES288_A04G166300v1 [Gossypium darwinii]
MEKQSKSYGVVLPTMDEDHEEFVFIDEDYDVDDDLSHWEFIDSSVTDSDDADDDVSFHRGELLRRNVESFIPLTFPFPPITEVKKSIPIPAPIQDTDDRDPSLDGSDDQDDDVDASFHRDELSRRRNLAFGMPFPFPHLTVVKRLNLMHDHDNDDHDPSHDDASFHRDEVSRRNLVYGMPFPFPPLTEVKKFIPFPAPIQDNDDHDPSHDGSDDQDDVDDDYGCDLDDELVPKALSGKFGRQRMRKLGKRAFAKMNTSKKSPYLYVRPGCVHGKHGLGLKHSF